MGLEGKFSVFHSAAVAVIDGAAGEEQYSDARVVDLDVVALREKVAAVVDPTVKEDAAHIEITMNDGTVHAKHVLHAIGSLNRPMSDADLERKFAKLCAPQLSVARVERLVAACWALDLATDAAELPRLCTPAP